MKKRLISFLVVLSIVFSFNISFAADISDNDVSPIEPLYVQVMNLSSTLNISNLGCATCTGTVSVRPGYNVKATIELLQLVDGSWDSITSWVHTGSGVAGVSKSETYWVNHGLYMVKTTAYVTDSNGKYIESPSATSLIREY